MSEQCTYHITPVPKPRQTRSDKWKKRPRVLRYRQFADEVRDACIKIHLSGTRIIFKMPMPESWSQKKKSERDGQPHMSRPDIDNLLKALLDAAFLDDSCVWSITATKVWSRTPGIEVENAGAGKEADNERFG